MRTTLYALRLYDTLTPVFSAPYGPLGKTRCWRSTGHACGPDIERLDAQRIELAYDGMT